MNEWVYLAITAWEEEKGRNSSMKKEKELCVGDGNGDGRSGVVLKYSSQLSSVC